MDQPPHPTADELGVSEGEYERIMRGVARRLGTEEPTPGSGPGGRAPAAASRTEPDRRPSRLPHVVTALAVATAVLVGLDRSGDDPEPVYAFTHVVDGRPATYSSCGPIPVAVYPAGGPPDAEQLVREAVTEMRAATGLDIVVVGAFGGHAPNWNFEAAPVHRDDPISVSWQDGDAIARLTDHVAGLGGSRTVAGRNGAQRLVAGTVALSRDYYATLTERGDHDEALAVLLHELGHVFGLAHVASEHELMSETNGPLTAFGPGDREGLRRLGRGPCF